MMEYVSHTAWLCGAASALLHLAAAFLPMSGDVRRECRSAVSEFAGIGLAMWTLSWMLGIGSREVEEITRTMQLFSGLYLWVFAILAILGGTAEHHRAEPERGEVVKLRHSAIKWSFFYFFMSFMIA